MADIFAQLGIDQTFYTQFAIFIAIFLIIPSLFFKPFQKLIEKRNHKFKNDAQSASDLLRAVESRLADYERALSMSRQESQANYEKAISDVRAKEDAAINSVKEELKKEYLKITQQLQEEKAKVESELKSQASQLADAVTQKILGK